MAETEETWLLQRPCSSTGAPRLMEKTKEELQLPQPPLEAMVDIDLLNSINNRLNDPHLNSRRLEPCTIYRVRESIRKENPAAYHPQLVAIGPYHRRDPTLLPMERVKNQFFRDLIARDGSNTVAKYIKALGDPSFVAKANKCYSEPVVLSEEGNDFVEMMMFDGCFIIEFLVKSFMGEDMGELGFVNWNRPIIENDLMLLENQIPFSVLQILYDSSAIPGLNEDFPVTLKDLAYTIFSRDISNYKLLPAVVHHLLHLRHFALAPAEKMNIPSKIGTLRSVTNYAWQHFILPAFFWLLLVLLTCRRPPRYKRGTRAPISLPNATEMDDFGIKFETKETSCMLDVTFKIRGGILEMPRLPIQALTVSRFRNLVAFEQCCPVAGNHFTAYVLLMDNLIDEAKDVALLEASGVLENKLGTQEEVAKLFNSLGKGAYLNYQDHYLVGLFKEVRKYSETDINIWRATIRKWKMTLMQNCFGSPRSTCWPIAGVILLLLTLCQTFFAAFAYFRPRLSA